MLFSPCPSKSVNGTLGLLEYSLGGAHRGRVCKLSGRQLRRATRKRVPPECESQQCNICCVPLDASRISPPKWNSSFAALGNSEAISLCFLDLRGDGEHRRELAGRPVNGHSLCPGSHHDSVRLLFRAEGIAAEGNVNQEQMVLADVDLNLLEEQRINGTVLPLNDLIKDAYDQVIHCTDRKPAVAAAEDRAIHETTRAL